MLFDDVKVLIVLSEAKSLSQAAEQLYMSRPGLSQKINTLEAKFGTKLIERTSTGIKLTRAGHLATDFARNVGELERGMAAQLAAIDESFGATMHVGMSMNDGVALLPGLVAGFVLVFPVLSALGIGQSDPVEALSIPIQQIGFVVQSDCPLSGEEQALLEQLVDLEDVKEGYMPFISDPMKLSLIHI